MQTHTTSGMETGQATGNGTARRHPVLAALLPWAIGGTVLGFFLWMALGSYYVRAFSDCINWLTYARDFGHEFTHSRWPYGFPLFLRGVMVLVGPYWVFIANIPVMLALFAVVSWVGTLFARRDAAAGQPPLPRFWPFLSVWVLVLATDVRSFPRYFNPYRDPLSYVLLMASVGLFVRSLSARTQCRRGWGVALAGAMLGLACSVREPSILMMFPLALYGILAWWAGRRGTEPSISFWGAVLPFGAGFTLAMLPFLVQTYLATHQVFLPPQASLEAAVVPGSHFNQTTLSSIGGDARSHYMKYEPMLLLLALAGVVAAVHRRNRPALALALPAAILYAVFYSFYWTFVVRYFYIAVLFLVLLAGYAIQSLLAFALARWPRRGRTAGWILLALLACASSLRLALARPKWTPHQVPQAKAMADEFRTICHDANTVFADRYLCEWLGWFGTYPSQPLPIWSLPLPGYTISDTIRAFIDPQLERGDNVYAAIWDGGRTSEPDNIFLRRALDRHPLGTIDTDKYNAYEYARGVVWIYRLSPWTENRTCLDWTVPAPSPHGPAYWYMLDAGDWRENDGEAIVTIDGATLSATIPHGGAWVGGVPADEMAPSPSAAPGSGIPVSATISADHPLPREMKLLTGPLAMPIPIDFRLYSPYDHMWRWSGDLLPRDSFWAMGPPVRSTAEVELPVPCPSLAGTILEWEMLSLCKVPGTRIPVSFWEGDRLLGSIELPADRAVVKFVTPLPWEPDRTSRTIRVEVQEQPNPAGPGAVVVCAEFYQVLVHRWPAAYPVDIRIGAPGDTLHVRSGFNAPEGRGESTYRWTSGPAEVDVFAPAATGPVVLSIAYATESIPPAVNPGNTLGVAWDGTPLEGTVEATDKPGGWLWKATLPPEALDSRVPHRLSLDAPSWRPADHGSRDSRTLGVRLQRIFLVPAE